MMTNLRVVLQRLLSALHVGRAEAGLAREIQAHLLLLEDRFRAQGMTAEEARVAAKRAFGGVEQAKERHRDARSFRWLGTSRMDLRLGARMLVKYPGLTAVAVLGMAVAIALAAGAFGIAGTLIDPVLPLDEADRIVAIQNWDRAATEPEYRALTDFVSWREELTTVLDLGAFRQVRRTLIAPGGQPEPVFVAEITASGFRVARVAPLIGRALVGADERDEAALVVVIGYDVWRARFNGDPAVLGRTVQFGEATHTVVGVMPEGFAFPRNNQWWVPLIADASRYKPRTGPQVFIFGRLVPGVSRESAQAELMAIGQRAASESPDTHAQLRPQVLPYTYPFTGMDDPAIIRSFRLAEALVAMLLIVVSVNVAILVYARTATRHAEIAVRSALGASRRRIIAQLCIEALVLSVAAAILGFLVTWLGFHQLNAAFLPVSFSFPFWIHFGLSPSLVVYVLVLTVGAAAIVGVVPALKATGRRVQTGLQAISSGGGSGMQLGRTWNVLIVAQVAFAVALLPGAVFHTWNAIRHGIADPGLTARELLTADVVIDRTGAPGVAAETSKRALDAQYRTRYVELVQRLERESGAGGVTFATALPGAEPPAWIEIEDLSRPSAADAESSDVADRAGTFGQEARFNRVGTDFFDVLDVPVLAGRSFTTADAAEGAAAIIVSQSFAQRLLGGTDVLGRRVRYVGPKSDAPSEHVELGTWYEIVGVVSDFPARATAPWRGQVKLYHTAAPGQDYPQRLIVRMPSAAAATLAGRLREVAAAVDPNLQLVDVARLDDVLSRPQRLLRLIAAAISTVTLSVVLLSAAGIYALMSFIVAQRRKEIGIRTALGADRGHILRSIFSRALAQLAIGALLGLSVAAALDEWSRGELMQGHGPAVLPIVAVVMMIVGLLSALGPARRGLRIDPMETLREQ